MNKRLSILFLICAIPAAALGPVHDARYTLEPTARIAGDAFFCLGTYFNGRFPGKMAVPLSVGLDITSRFELGAGLKTYWINTDEYITHVAAGFSYKAGSGFKFQGDLLFGVSRSASSGLALGVLKERSYGNRLSTLLDIHTGFFEGLAGRDGIAAVELGYYPLIRVVDHLSVQTGLIASSTVGRFEDDLAIDFQPGIRVPVDSRMHLSVTGTFGLAGNRKEDSRFDIVIRRGF